MKSTSQVFRDIAAIIYAKNLGAVKQEDADKAILKLVEEQLLTTEDGFGLKKER